MKTITLELEQWKKIHSILRHHAEICTREGLSKLNNSYHGSLVIAELKDAISVLELADEIQWQELNPRKEQEQ